MHIFGSETQRLVHCSKTMYVPCNFCSVLKYVHECSYTVSVVYELINSRSSEICVGIQNCVDGKETINNMYCTKTSNLMPILTCT